MGMLILAKVGIFKRMQCLAYAASPLATTGWHYLFTLKAVPLCMKVLWGLRASIYLTPIFTQPKKDNVLFFTKASLLILAPMKKHLLSGPN